MREPVTNVSKDTAPWRSIASLCGALAILQGAAPTPPARAREHGRPRQLDAITTVVVHTVGGPSCIGGKIVFRPVPARADDAAFWRDALRSAPVADAHIVIGRDGTVASVMPLSEVANHTTGANATSVGIELVHRGDGREPFEPAQIAALIATVENLRGRFPTISLERIVRHSDLDQRTCVCAGTVYYRRQDPGTNFPMDKVIAAVRRPYDPPRGTIKLNGLTGAAPGAACPIF